LPKDERENADPAWSHDGRSLAFQSNRTGTSQIYVLRIADCSVRQVTKLESGPDPAEAPDWSPNGRWIVFSRLDRGLWVVRAEGTGLTQVIGGEANWPAWSPNGRTIVFSRGYPDYQLFAVPAKGGKLRGLGPGVGAAWSPDGRRLAFVRGIEGATWVMRADGTQRQRVTHGAINGDQDLAWSPDGRRLVIAGSTEQGLTLFVKTLGGRLTHVAGSGNAWAPDWSPDGRELAFARTTSDRSTDLFLISPSGGTARPLTVTPDSGN
jgi:Tol biopolymer transport system component